MESLFPTGEGCLPGTRWPTGYVNVDCATCSHRDDRDREGLLYASSQSFQLLLVPAGIPCAVACTGTSFLGGHLLFPEYSLALVFQCGSIAIFEGSRELHCSLPPALKENQHIFKWVIYGSGLLLIKVDKVKKQRKS